MFGTEFQICRDTRISLQHNVRYVEVSSRAKTSSICTVVCIKYRLVTDGQKAGQSHDDSILRASTASRS